VTVALNVCEAADADYETNGESARRA